MLAQKIYRFRLLFCKQMLLLRQFHLRWLFFLSNLLLHSNYIAQNGHELLGLVKRFRKKASKMFEMTNNRKQIRQLHLRFCEMFNENKVQTNGTTCKVFS